MHPIYESIRSGLLQVSGIYQTYWEESGNPDGLPVIFLHGGPGAGASPVCRGLFNPDMLRIVIIDQCGRGRPLPYVCTDDNMTWDSVAGIEKVCEMLGIRKWSVFGDSWGSTLSLAHTETHPERVIGLVLHEISLCRSSETVWLDEAGGVSQIYPAQWQKFLASAAEEKRGGLIVVYYEMLSNEDEAGRLEVAKAWADWESCLIRSEPQDVDEDVYQSLAIARLENHYSVNEGWLKGDKAILANTDKIRHIPTVIVQGYYDLCTPMQSAWELSQVLLEAELCAVQAGHLAFDALLAEALVRAMGDMEKRVDWS